MDNWAIPRSLRALVSVAPLTLLSTLTFNPIPMIVVIRPNTPRDQIDAVIAEVQKLGYDPRPIFGTEQTVIAAIGDERTHHTLESLTVLPQVEKVMPVQKRYKLVSRESHPGNSVVERRWRSGRRREVLSWRGRARWRARNSS